MINVLVRSKGADRSLQLYFVDPLTKKEVSKSAETSDRGEAERAAALWEQELRAFRGNQNDGWEYFRFRFLESHLATLSKSGRLSYGTALNHLKRIAKPKCLSDITADVLSQFQATLIKEGRPLTSICNYLTHIRHALNWAGTVGMIHKVPKVSMPRSGKRKFMRGRPLTPVEFKTMRRACAKVCGTDAIRYQRAMDLMWFTGMRLSEALICSWDRPPIRLLLDGKPYPQIMFLLEGQKSRQDETIPMCPDFVEWLKQTPLRQRHGLVAPLPLKSVDRVSEMFSAIGKAAKIIVNDEDGKYASAHDLRRGFGTRWAQVVRPLTLQKLMRHANIETTLKYYVGLSAADAGAELWGVPANVPKQARKRTSAG